MTGKKPSRRNRPALVKVSEEMKAWAAALEAELATWPHVTTRSMFGLTAAYRKDQIFAALPRTRGLECPNAIAFKLEGAGAKLLALAKKDPRITTTIMQKTRWLTYEIDSGQKLQSALIWLDRAYELAK